MIAFESDTNRQKFPASTPISFSQCFPHHSVSLSISSVYVPTKIPDTSGDELGRMIQRETTAWKGLIFTVSFSIRKR